MLIHNLRSLTSLVPISPVLKRLKAKLHRKKCISEHSHKVSPFYMQRKIFASLINKPLDRREFILFLKIVGTVLLIRVVLYYTKAYYLINCDL